MAVLQQKVVLVRPVPASELAAAELSRDLSERFGSDGWSLVSVLPAGADALLCFFEMPDE